MAKTESASVSLDNPLAGGQIFSPQSLREDDLLKTNVYLKEALEADKKQGLLLAVRARWIALGIIAVLLPFLNFRWEMLYYEALLIGFALIGWAQLKAGQVGQSRRELLLIFADLALMTFTLVMPNPFFEGTWPTAMQYVFDNFIYFFVLLAGGTLAYSWRTVFAMGTWTAGLWMVGVLLVIFFGTEYPDLSEKLKVATADYERMAEIIDPNSPNVPARIQDIVVFMIVAGILALNGWRTTQLLVRQAEAARERANLARHFPPTMVEKMAHTDQPLSTVSSETVTVMFTDIVGFTHIAEQKTPEQVVDLLRTFHQHMEQAVFANGGTLDKFLGDGIMATFGTPTPRPDDAERALKCAYDMIHAMANWNVKRQAAGEDVIRLSVGLHTGPVVLGNIGSARRLEFATLGDSVNVASRLESLTRELGVEIVVSDTVVEAIRQQTTSTALLDKLHPGDEQELRGRDDPIKIWTFSFHAEAEIGRDPGPVSPD